MKIAIDCDDAATELKSAILGHLRESGVEVTDLNFQAANKVDYPDVALHLATRVAQGEFNRGILLCGTGLGMAMVANKVPGIFAGTCHDVYSAERLCKSNNGHILTMGARVVGVELAKTIVTAWVRSSFEGGRSLPKVDRMREIDASLRATLRK